METLLNTINIIWFVIILLIVTGLILFLTHALSPPNKEDRRFYLIIQLAYLVSIIIMIRSNYEVFEGLGLTLAFIGVPVFVIFIAYNSREKRDTGERTWNAYRKINDTLSEIEEYSKKINALSLKDAPTETSPDDVQTMIASINDNLVSVKKMLFDL